MKTLVNSSKRKQIFEMTSVQLKALVRPISKLFKTKSGLVKEKMKTCELGKLKTHQREYRYLKMTSLQLKALVQPISKLFIKTKKIQKERIEA